MSGFVVECPGCGSLFAVSGDPADYDWDSGVSLGGVAAVDCPGCGSPVEIEAQGIVTDVEVVVCG